MARVDNKASSSTFRFRKLDSIGNPSAESDDRFLSPCFVDTGLLDLLRNTQDQRGILLGRTGAGKTALLRLLSEKEAHVITLDPHAMALSYLSNSTVLRFFEGLGVRMDPFYKFLWRHVFVVEILKNHFNIEREDQQLNFFENLRYRVQRKKVYLEALDYLQKWGTRFIASTEERIKDLTRKVESNLEANAEASLLGWMKLGARGASRLSEEQKLEFTQRGHEVLNSLQLHHLYTLFDALDETFLTDEFKRYYFVIDRLDEDWVDEPSRYRLIRALIELMRDVNSGITNAKIIIALRVDLFDRVLQSTTDAGFQGEKYHGLALPISWNGESLTEVLDKRVSAMVQFQYSGQAVTLKDVLPTSMTKGKQRGIDYILERTLLRPRDAIAFFNSCMDIADGDPTISTTKLLLAEPIYSDQRLQALADEWSVQYPHLMALCYLLRERPASFRLKEWTRSDLDHLCLTVFSEGIPLPGEDAAHLLDYFDNVIGPVHLRICLARVLYRVGMVGLKTGAPFPVRWSHSGLSEIPASLINDSTVVHVHKMLWRVLGIKD